MNAIMTQAMKKIVLLCFTLFMMATSAMASELNLSVAASLKEVINELTANYTAKHPGTVFLKNFGPSGTLAGQIENGGPADLIISANTEWVDYLNNKKLVDAASIKTFTYNSLVFVGTTSKKVTSMKDLMKLDKIAIGSPKSVPAGEYAMAAMTKTGVAAQLTSKLIMAKDVRECLMYAELGEVDGAFVYKTDALQAQKSRLLFTVPQELYSRVVYPLAITIKGAKNDEVKAFHTFLQGDEAKTVLSKYGFALK
ncbi:MAG: molybdate ABC transporter substrate-binding protein [Chlorobiales bacterium]|nr:molybdate ABC transporter substrate-binding protein [Chlorobiales bacterium]